MTKTYSTKKCKYCNKKVPIISGSHGNFCSLYCRLWAKVKVTNITECWEWQAAKDHFGYGLFSINRKHNIAHRVVYSLLYGEILESLEVCHKCDNPSCCNPFHLFLGTHKDNMEDMVNKNRQSRFPHLHNLFGQNHPNTKLNDNDVRFIKLSLKENTASQADLVKIFNVGKNAIHYINAGRTWKHIIV